MEDAGREKMHEDKDEEEGSSVGEVQQAVEPIKVNKPARKVGKPKGLKAKPQKVQQEQTEDN